MRSFENITHLAEENADTNRNEDNNMEKTNSIEKLPKPVYYVESPDDGTVLVGMDVTIEHNRIGSQEAHRISWYDTVRERSMTASEIIRKDDDFAFQRADQEGGGSYHFTPMDLEVYNDKVKQRLIAGRDFTNNDDLTKAFLETMEDDF